MAEPVRNDDPLSEIRFPESPGTARTASPGPVPLRTSAQPAGLIPDTLPDRPLGAWPETDEDSNFRLRKASERVGSALGTVVNQSKEISGTVQDRVSELKRKFAVIAGRRSAEIRERASDLSDSTQRRASELATEARREARLWEFRARMYARRSPLQFIAGVAFAGFALGFLLRMGRDE